MTILINSLRSLLLVLCALVLLPRQGVAQGADTDAYGGSTRVRWEATGWFRLQQNGGRFWLVTPEGHPFFNLGINHLASGMDNAQRADVALATELTRKFKSWHFNTAGYNASPLFAKDTPFVSFLNLVPTSRFLRDKASFPDVFDAAFQRDLQTRIEHQCRDVRDNPRLLGYVWTDTPLWNLKDARRTIKKDWVSTLRQLAAAAPGKIAYVDFLLETHGGDFAKIAQIYDVKATSRAELLAAPFDAVRVDAPAVAAEDAQFLRRIARTFYGVAGPAYRKNDPHHLVWGEMYLQGVHPDEVLEEAMPHIDVLLIQPTGNPAAKEPKDHFPRPCSTVCTRPIASPSSSATTSSPSPRPSSRARCGFNIPAPPKPSPPTASICARQQPAPTSWATTAAKSAMSCSPTECSNRAFCSATANRIPISPARSPPSTAKLWTRFTRV